MDALNQIEKIIRKRLLKKVIKKPGLKFNHGFALIGHRTTGHRAFRRVLLTVDQQNADPLEPAELAEPFIFCRKK